MNRKSFHSNWFPDDRKEAIRGLVEDRLTPDEAAKIITENVLSDINDVEGEIENMVGMLMTATRAFPDKHAHLVQLLVSMTQLPQPFHRDDTPIVLDSYKALEWSNIVEHDFAFEVHSEWNGFGGKDPDSRIRNNLSTLQSAIDLYYTFNHFAALSTKTSNLDLDFRRECLWTFAEKPFEEPITASVDFETLQWLVPGAAVWISILGEEIYTWTDETGLGRVGSLWGERQRFCVERWQLWKSQFKAIAELEGMDDRTKRLAADTHARMAEIDGSIIQNGV